MKEAKIIIGKSVYYCIVIPGRYTCHPASKLCHAEDVKDERLPMDCIIFCGKDKSVHILPWRYGNKVVEGKKIQTRVCINEDDDRIWISTDSEGINATWRSDWRSVECYSEGHAEFILDLLISGNLQDVETSAQIKLISGFKELEQSACVVSS